MATVEDILNVARGELGTTSGKKYWDAYFGGGYVNGSVTPWCACFTSWLLQQVDVYCPGFPRAVAIDAHDDFDGRGVSKWSLQPGDMLGFDWDGDSWGDHIGIVEWIDGGIAHTIEGNTSGGRVARCSRSIASVVTNGVRPFYDDSPAARKLEVDGYIGPATIREWQRQMGSPYVDGIISGQKQGFYQHFWAVERDQVDFDGGSGDSWMVREMQKRIGVGQDGVWGPVTSKALQKWLQGKGYDIGSAGCDGYVGRDTAKALQRSLNDKAWE